MSTSSPKKIALIGTLDTKGEELGFVKKDCVRPKSPPGCD